MALQKKQKTQEKDKLRKTRSRLRNITKSASFIDSPEDVELLCTQLSLQKLTDLLREFEKGEGEAKELFFKEVFIYIGSISLQIFFGYKSHSDNVMECNIILA